MRLARADVGGLELYLVEDVGEVGVELVDGKAVGGVEGQRDHGLDLGEVHAHAALVVGHAGRGQRAEVLLAAVLGQELARLVVGHPDGRQAGGLGGHDVDAVAVVAGHARHARAHELHDLVLDVAALEDGGDDGQGHVVRAHAGARRALQVDGHHVGVGHVVGVAQELLGKLAAALADGHGAQGAVAGVGVRPQDHLATAGEVLAHEGVDDGDVGWHEDAAVLARGRQAEDVVVLVDGPAHGAQGVVAVGEHVGQRELLHARGARRLDDAHEGDVVARHGVEADLEVRKVRRGVVGLQDGVRDGARAARLDVERPARLLGVGRGLGRGHEGRPVEQEHAGIEKFNRSHRRCLSVWAASPGGHGHVRPLSGLNWARMLRACGFLADGRGRGRAERRAAAGGRAQAAATGGVRGG